MVIRFCAYPGGGASISGDGLHMVIPEQIAAAEHQETELALFIANYPFLWANREIIFSTPELYDAPLSFAGLSCAYLGGGPVTLGILFELWSCGHWTGICGKCGGSIRIYSLRGSILSGTNGWMSFCKECGAQSKGSVDSKKDGRSFASHVMPALELIRKHAKPVNVKHPSFRSDFLTFSRRCTEKPGEKKPAASENEKLIIPVDDTKNLEEVILFLKKIVSGSTD